MDRATTIWRVLVAGFAVWRLSRLLFAGERPSIGSRFLSSRPENFFGDRILDGVCCLSIWLSAQTAIWVAGGLAGVVLNWFALSLISRCFAPSPETQELSNGDMSCLTVERNMQVNHG